MNSAGFPPIANSEAKVLILGSLPGQVSLQRGEYYAQPRNAFWAIMAGLFAIPADAPYAERTARLAARGVALWDVCAEAFRPGSLDSAITHASVVANDFADFFATHPRIGLVAFNGAKAAELYRRIVLPRLSAAQQGIPMAVLPSTSPAYAAMPFSDKLARWSLILLPALAAR